jgi:hypothetical protein
MRSDGNVALSGIAVDSFLSGSRTPLPRWAAAARAARPAARADLEGARMSLKTDVAGQLEAW